VRIDQLLALLNEVDLDDLPRIHDSDLKNLDRARKLLPRLAEAPELESFVTPLINSAIFGTNRDSFYVSADERSRIQNAVTRLHLTILGLREALKVHAPPADAESIVIKLPDPSDFTDALSVLDQIRTSIEQIVVNPTIEGHTKLVGWEIGSFWIYLNVGTEIAVRLVGSVVWAAAVVRRKVLEGNALETKMRGLDLESKALDALLAGIKKDIEVLLDSEAIATYKKHFGPDQDNEQVGRIKFAIRSFSELIARGAEIHPSLNAPPEAKEIFPDIAKLGTISSQIRQIEKGPSVP
jgi:hypothetical protein